MTRYCGKSVLLVVAIIVLGATCCGAFQLLAPTEGQAVRENVKIRIAASVVPDGGFIAVMIGDPGAEKFVVAISRDAAKPDSDSNLTFYWDSKAPYYESGDPSKPHYFKDGRYPMNVQVHESAGKVVDSASTTIELKNRVARTNPAPGVSLVNALTFGQVNNYRVHCDVSVFEMVNRIGLPLLGGMGLSGDSVIIQSVEDARPGGEYLLRLREDEKTWVSAYGVKKYIYADQEFKPQLYRLIDKYGKVITDNMFAKQAKYEIMDVLPALPTQAVKEGDSWPDSMTLKIDGITRLMTLKGSAMLDSFEWEGGRECAKITAMLSGDTPISLGNGKIKGTGPLNAQVTTYFAYKTGRMIERNIRLTFDASIGMGDASGGQAQPLPPPGMGTSPLGEDQFNQDLYGPGGPPSNAPPPGMGQPGGPGSQPGIDTSRKKGKAELDIVVRLEK
jgi:hypothetical protein